MVLIKKKKKKIKKVKKSEKDQSVKEQSEANPFGFDPGELLNKAVDSDLDPTVLDDIDDEWVPKPSNIFQFMVSRKFLGIDPFPMQVKILTELFEEYCVSGRTLLFTDKGIKRINSFYDQDGEGLFPKSINLATRSGVESTSHYGLIKRNSPMLRAVLYRGFSLEGTHNQKVLVLSRNLRTHWKRLDSLKIGDRVGVQLGSNIWSHKNADFSGFVEEESKYRRAEIWPTPTRMTKKLAYALGYLISEGTVTGQEVVFTNTNPRLIRHYVSCLRGCFGNVPLLYRKYKRIDSNTLLVRRGYVDGTTLIQKSEREEKCTASSTEFPTSDYSLRKWAVDIRMSSRHVLSFLRYCGLLVHRAPEKRIPWSILQSKPSIVKRFLRSFLEGDGSTSSERIRFLSTSESLLTEIHQVLLNFGILSTLKGKCVTIRGENWITKYDSVVGYIPKSPKRFNLESLGNLSFARDNLPYISAKLKSIYSVNRTAAKFLKLCSKVMSLGISLTEANYEKVRQNQVTQGNKNGCKWKIGLTQLNQNYANNLSSFVPAYWDLRSQFRKNRYLTYEWLGQNPSILSSLKTLHPKLAARIEKILRDRLLWLETTLIEDAGIGPVYDVTVPGSHSFLANGIVAHNCPVCTDMEFWNRVKVDTPLSEIRDRVQFLRFGKCISGDSLIITDHGLLPMRSPHVGGGVGLQKKKLNLVTEVGVEKSSYYGMTSQCAKVVRVRARHGVIEGTNDHRVRVLTKDLKIVWKRIENLKIGDHIGIKLGTNLWSSSAAKLNDFEYTPKRGNYRHQGALPKIYSTPSTVTKSFAKLLGYLSSEGSFPSSRRDVFRFCNTDLGIINDYTKCLADCFGVDLHYTKVVYQKNQSCKPVTDIIVTSAYLREFLEYAGLHGVSASHKQIPWCVLESKSSLVKEYVRAYLEGDGSVSGQDSIRFFTTSFRMATQLQTVLANFGIVSSLQPKKKIERHHHTVWAIVITGSSQRQYVSTIGFTNGLVRAKQFSHRQYKKYTVEEQVPFLKEYLRKLYSNNKMRLPDSVNRRRLSYEWLQTNNLFTELTRYAKFQSTRTREGTSSDQILSILSRSSLSSKLNKLLSTKLHWSKVVSVKPLRKPVDVYDITVPGSHSFVANNVVVHNCKKCGKTKNDFVAANLFNFREELVGCAGQRCVSGDSILFTNHGLLEIRELKPNGIKPDEFSPLSNLEILGKKRESASDFYYRGKDIPYIFETEFGFRERTSSNHPVLILNNGKLGFRQVQDLKIGDSVAISTKNDIWGQETSVTGFVDNTIIQPSNEQVTIPTELTEELATYLGYLVSDGSYNNQYIFTFSAEDKTRGDDFIKLTKKLFNIDISPSYIHQKDVAPPDYRDYIFCSASVRRFFEYLGLEKTTARKKCIPRAILKAPKNVVCAFLTGLLEGDGCLSQTEDSKIRFNTVSRRLARQVHMVLLNLGIVASLYRTETPDFGGGYTKEYGPAYCVQIRHQKDITKLLSELRFRSNSKLKHQEILANILVAKREEDYYIPVGVCLRGLVAEVTGSEKATRRRSNRFRRLTGVSLRDIRYGLTGSEIGIDKVRIFVNSLTQSGVKSEYLRTLKTILDRGLTFVKVTKIRQGKKPIHLYDLNVPGSHSFVANGIVNHNSTKSAMVAGMVAPYHLARFLTLKSPSQTFGLLSGTQLMMTFSALTAEQSRDNLWVPYFQPRIDQSPWFKTLHRFLDEQGKKLGVPLYKKMDTFIHYRHKQLYAHYTGADFRTLRGRTRFFAAIDELGFFDIHNKGRVMANAHETYISLSNCVVGSTLIPTSHGILPIGSLFKGKEFDEEGFSPFQLNLTSHTGPAKSAYLFDGGEVECRRLTLDDGRKLSGSTTHPIMVLQPNLEVTWKPLAEVEPNDYVAVKLGNDTWPTKQYKVNWSELNWQNKQNSNSLNCKYCKRKCLNLYQHIKRHGLTWAEYTQKYGNSDKISDLTKTRNRNQHVKPIGKVPRQIDENLAEILGYLVSEGNTKIYPGGHHKVTFTQKNRLVTNDYLTKLRQVFPDIDVKAKKHRSLTPKSKLPTHSYCVSIDSTNLLSYLNACGLSLTTAYHKKIPTGVLQSPPEVVASYLRAYFEGDGHVSKSGFISATSASRLLIRQTQILLGYLGIDSKVSSQLVKTPKSKEWRRYHVIRIFGRGVLKFRQIIGTFISKHKKHRLENVCARSGHKFTPIPYATSLIKSMKGEKWSGRSAIYECEDGVSRFVGFNSINSSKRVTLEAISGNNSVVTSNLSLLSAKLGKRLSVVRSLMNNGIRWKQVKKNLGIGIHHVYDFNIPGPHSFIGNNIVNHNSLRTVRSSAFKRQKRGEYNIPTGIMANISSPSAIDDEIMTLVTQASDPEKGKRIYAFHFATHEINPEMPYESLQEEAKAKGLSFERDFLAIPPLSNAPFIPDKPKLDKIFCHERPPLFQIEEQVKSAVHMGEDEVYFWGKVVSPQSEKTIPRCVAVDAGETNNSFAAAIGYYDNIDDKIVVEQLVELRPGKDRNRVFFPGLLDDFFKILADNFWIRFFVLDQWGPSSTFQQSLNVYKKGTEADVYSLNWNDFQRIKSGIIGENVVFPRTPYKFSDYKPSEIAEVFKAAGPIPYLKLQLHTCREVGKKIIKPVKDTDDLMRATSLLIHYIYEYKEEFSNYILGTPPRFRRSANPGYISLRKLGGGGGRAGRGGGGGSAPSVVAFRSSKSSGGRSGGMQVRR